MRTTRKVVAFIVTLSLVLGTFGTAFAGTETFTTPGELTSKLAEQMTLREGNIVLTFEGADVSPFVDAPISKLLTDAYNNTSDDYLKYNWTSFRSNYNYTTESAINRITVSAIATYLTTKAEEDILSAKVTEVLAQIITPGMTELEKVTAIHKYVIDHVAYDNLNRNHSAYDGLIEGTTVCQGYALLMEKMCEQAGIQSIIVTGRLGSVGHAWNIVRIDGVYYHVDATNDDTRNNMFFLVSDEVLTAYKFTWTKANYPACGISITPTSTSPAIITPPIISTTPAVSIIPTTPVAPSIKIIKKSNSASVLAAAETLVSAAEQSPKAIYISKAMQYINMIAESPEKTALINRLNAISTQMDSAAVTSAQAAIATAKITLNMADVSKADRLISMVQNAATRNDLKSQLETVRQDILIASAEVAVTRAETTVNATYVKNAQKIVNSLMAGSQKDSFNARLAAVNIILQTNLETTAESYVAKAEVAPSVAAVSSAERAISVLNAGSVKTALTTRIVTVKTAMTQAAIQKATAQVSQAETLKTLTSYTIAVKSVVALPNGAEKTALLNRLTSLKTAITQ